MECLYTPDLKMNEYSVEISTEERKHLKALRVKENDEILLSNGLGLAAKCLIHFDKKWNPNCEILDFLPNYGEIENYFSLFVCNLHNKERMELLVEKATELGAAELFIPICFYSQSDKIEQLRLQKKAIAALKQSKRSKLLKITPLKKSENYYDIFKNFENIILLDEEGESPMKRIIRGNSLILVGPEGGFSRIEIDSFENYKGIVKWYLGKRRLRTETAALKALSIITSMNE